MIKVNGQELEWAGYQFGVKDNDGRVWMCADFDDARISLTDSSDQIVMRSLYATAWEDKA